MMPSSRIPAVKATQSMVAQPSRLAAAGMAAAVPRMLDPVQIDGVEGGIASGKCRDTGQGQQEQDCSRQGFHGVNRILYSATGIVDLYSPFVISLIGVLPSNVDFKMP